MAFCKVGVVPHAAGDTSLHPSLLLWSSTPWPAVFQDTELFPIPCVSNGVQLKMHKTVFPMETLSKGQKYSGIIKETKILVIPIIFEYFASLW